MYGLTSYVLAQTIPLKYPQKQLAKEQQKIILVSKEKPREKLMF